MKKFNEKLASWIHATPATEAGINTVIPASNSITQ
ncbi:hypothetical protein ACFMKL_15615, partial [Acinetobacter baumannii]